MRQVGQYRSRAAPAIRRFAREWADVLGSTCYLPWDPREAVESLHPLTEALAELLRAPRLDPAAARRLGHRLAMARYRGPDALRATLRLIRTRATELLEVRADSEAEVVAVPSPRRGTSPREVTGPANRTQPAGPTTTALSTGSRSGAGFQTSTGPEGDANFDSGAAIPDTATAGRIADLIDELAAGYADGVRERTQREQEQLLDAVLRTRRQAEAAMRDSEQRFRAIFTEAGVGIALVGLDGQVFDVNPALYRLFNVAGPIPKPRPITDHVHPEDAPAMIADFRDLSTGRRDNAHGEMRLIRPDGTVIWTYVTSSLVRKESGDPDYVIAVLEDVTERQQLRSRLRHQTYHDQLTRLPNRAMMNEQLRWAFSPDSSVRRVGLCHLDLDEFRAINDSMGPQAGDQLLLAVAGRLQLLADGHLVTRTGGDEFAVLVTDPPSVDYLCELAEHLLAGLAPPFVIGTHRLSITASLGIVESAVTRSWPEELQRAAEAARSWAKSAGGGRWALFDPDRDAGETSRFALAASVPGAVDRHEFQLYYQPLVQLATGRLVGVEALVRWRHPEHGLLGPTRFIDLAERNGAIVPLGRWVLSEACRQARRWADQLAGAAPYVSVNVAPRQLAEPGWLTEVAGVLADTGLPARQLQLEITERAVLMDTSGSISASDNLRALRDMGVRLVIDDFGTGYSSLSYLRRLPVQGLKIDGSFIQGLRETRDNAAPVRPVTGPDAPGQPGLSERGGGMDGSDTAEAKIVAALISMAQALGLVVTAEWVETADQASRLRTLGCDVAQGHWFGDPVPANQLAPRLPRPRTG